MMKTNQLLVRIILLLGFLLFNVISAAVGRDSKVTARVGLQRFNGCGFYAEDPRSVSSAKSAPGRIVRVASQLLSHVSGGRFAAGMDSQTALIDAVSKEDVEAIREAVAAGADVNKPGGEDGAMALFIACSLKNKVIIRQLIKEYGATLDIFDVAGNTPLHVACFADSFVVAEVLIKQKKSGDERSIFINTSNLAKKTALHVACECSPVSPDLIELLLKHGAAVNVPNAAGMTALHLLCENPAASSEHIKLLLKYGADVDVKSAEGKTAAQLAWECGRKDRCMIADVIGAAVEQQASDAAFSNVFESVSITARRTIDKVLGRPSEAKQKAANEVDAAGDTLLHVACRENDLKKVQQLLGQKAVNPNVGNNDGQAPLHIACGMACVDVDVSVVNALLKHSKIDLNSVNKKGETPLDIVYSMYCIYSHKLKKENIDEEIGAKYGAIVNNCLMLMRVLLGHSSIAENVGLMFLQRACDFNQFAVAEVLLKNNKHARAAVAEHAGLLMRQAFGHANAELVKLLWTNGACIQSLDSSMFIDACRRMPADIVKPLLETVEDPLAGDVARRTLLHVACEGNNESVVALLLNSKKLVLRGDPWVGGYPNVADDQLITPLHIAAANNNLPIVSMLLEYGANANAREVKGMSALHIACNNPNADPELVKDLVKQSVAAKNSTDGIEGNTPLHFAVRNARIDLVGILVGDKDVHINMQNNAGEFPLHIACALPSSELASDLVGYLLSQEGVLLDRENGLGLTPLAVACLIGNVEAARLLLSRGAVVTAFIKGHATTSVMKNLLEEYAPTQGKMGRLTAGLGHLLKRKG